MNRVRADHGGGVRDGLGKVVIGISPSLSGLEALRFAVAEARRRRVTLAAVQAWSFSGGVVRRCARDAGCPVVVVPRPELARAVGGRLAARRMMREAAAALAAEPDHR